MSLNLIEGFILNIPTDYKWGMVKFPLKRKHWITIRQVGQQYYNLDSKLDAPEVIGGGNELVKYLREQVKSSEKELLLVVAAEVAQEGRWYDSESSVCEQNGDTERVKLSEGSTSQYGDSKTLMDDKVAEPSESDTKQNGEITSTPRTSSIKVAPCATTHNGDIRRTPSPASKYEV